MVQQFYQSSEKLVFDPSSDAVYISRKHDIPDEFLDECRRHRDASTEGPMGDSHMVASIPEGVFADWLANGFDPIRETPRAIINRLKAEGLDGFITTNRRLW
jgi:hypothetical protein